MPSSDTRLSPSPATPAPVAAPFPRQSHAWTLLFLAAALVRLPGLTQPYVERFVWRSLDNAAIARNFLTSGMDIRYPRVDWAGPEGYVETELPLLMYAAACLYRLLGGEVAWVGRLLTLLCSLGLLGVFARFAKGLVGAKAAFIATIFLAFVPTSIFFSRLFQQDALMLLCQVGALLLAWKWLGPESPEVKPLTSPSPHTPRSPVWIPVMLTFTLALGALVKPTALLIGLPIVVLAFQRFGLRALWQPKLYAVVIGSLIPPLLWYAHARQVYLDHGYTFGIFSGGHDKFQWERFLAHGYWYREMLTRMFTWHLTPAGVVLSVLGFAMLLRIPHRAKALLLTWTLTMVGSIFLVAEGNLDMLYYQWTAIPPLALLAGLAAKTLLDAGKKWRTGFITLLVLSVSGVSAQQLVPAYGLTQKRPLELANLIRQTVPDGALLLDAGAYDTHNPGGYNFEPHQFYYSGHKGWGLLESDFSAEGLERYRKQGAQFLVSSRAQRFDAHPTFKQYVLERYKPLIQKGDLWIVDIR